MYIDNYADLLKNKSLILQNLKYPLCNTVYNSKISPPNNAYIKSYYCYFAANHKILLKFLKWKWRKS